MRLIEIARNVIKILQESSEQGCLSSELIRKLGIPQRRIY